MDDKDDIDDEDDDKPNLRSNMSGPSSLDRRVGSATQVAHLRPSEMGSKGLLFSFVFSPSTLLSGSQFSTSAGRHASLFDDQDEDMSTPTPLPPPPTVKTDPQGQGQGQQKEEETVKDLEMQIEKLQARLEEKKMLEKKEQLSSSINNSVKGQRSDKEYEKLSKVERSNSNDWGEEWKMQTGNAEDSGDIVIENNVYVPSKPADKKEVPISKLLKKDSFNKTKFNQEDFLNSLLSSPPTSTKRVLKGEGTGAWRMPPDAKKHGGGISNKEMHQRSKHMADERIKDCSTAGGFEEGIGRNLDSGWESIEEGVFENQFFDYKIPQDVVEISLPANPNIPHTRSRRVEGYEYTEQNVFNSDSAPPSDSKSNLVNSFQNENTPGKTFSVNDNFQDSRNHSMEYSDLPPLKYPDHSPITSPPTTGDGKNPSSPNISNVESGHNTQLPPKRKSQEVTAPSGDSSFVPELDEEDISGYHEFNTSNRTSYSKAPGTSPHHSMSRYSSYMSSLQSLSDHFGYVIKDVTPDGNCMFSAIIDQLRIQGNFDLTPNSLRKTAVEYLRNNPKNQDGTHLESFLSTETWEEYLSRMGQESQWGDHMVLQACTEVTGQKIVVFKPNTNKTVLVPTAEEPDENQSLTLGHIGESHFVSLRPKDWETNWPLMAHAHRAKTKEKQKLARKKRREMKKSKKQKMTLDTTVSNKEEPTTTDEKGKEKESEKGKEMESDKEEQKESEKGKEKENEDGKETWGEEGKKTGSGAELRETEGATKAVVETGSGAEVPETEGATMAAVAETGSGAEVPETESATKAAVAETGSGAEVLETEGATKAAVAETVSGAEVPETEGATKAAVTENEPDEDEDDEDDEEEAESDDSQFKTTDGPLFPLLSGCDIDEQSGVPFPHLQFATRYLIHPYYIRTVEIDAMDTAILRSTDQERLNTRIVGSVAEGLCVKLGDFSDDGLLKTFEKYSTLMETDSEYQSNRQRFKGKRVVGVVKLFKCGYIDDYNDFYLDTTCALPGYTVIRPTGQCLAISRQFGLDATGIMYFKHPPSLLCGIYCHTWPEWAREWESLRNLNAWPGSSVANQMKATSCILLSRAHPSNEQNDSEWQIIFPDAENMLAQALTPEMKSCFFLYKLLVDFHTRQLNSKLKTTHLKTVMYDVCESVPATAWKSSPAACLLYLLDSLWSRLHSGILPNYFIQQNNMIDHFSETDRRTLEERLKAVRTFPLIALVLLADAHGIEHDWFTSHVFEDCQRFGSHKDITHTIEQTFIPSLVDLATSHITHGRYRVACDTMHEAYSKWSFEKYQDDCKPSERMNKFLKRILRNNNDASTLTLMYHLDKAFGTNLITSKQKAGCAQTMKDVVGRYEAGEHADVFVGPQVWDDVITMIRYLDNYAFMQYAQGRIEESAQFLRCAIAKGKTYIQDRTATKEYRNTFYWDHGTKRIIDEYEVHIELLSVYSHLRICYYGIGQISLFQEYVLDYEESCDRSGGDIEAYKEVESLWRVLGNPRKADEIKEKVSSWERETSTFNRHSSAW